MVENSDNQISQTEATLISEQAELTDLQSKYSTLYGILTSTREADQQTIDELKAEIDDLSASYDTKKFNIQNELNSIQIGLNLLIQNNDDIAAELQSQMLALALLVDSDSSSISALHIQVSVLSGSLTLLNAKFNSLNARYLQLRSLLETTEASITQAQDSMPTLYAWFGQIRNTDNMVVFRYTDSLGLPDADILDNFRDFFAANNQDTSVTPRWVYFGLNTGNGTRVTEQCFYDDNNYFAGFSDKTENTSRGGGDIVYYGRLNNTTWYRIPYSVTVYSDKTSSPEYSRDTVAIYAYKYLSYYFELDNTNAQEAPEYSLYDTRHQYNYLTETLRMNTEVTVIMAPFRRDACGF